MNWWRKLRLRLGALFQKRQLDAEMEEEMRSHIEMQTLENLDAGMNPEEARYAALRPYGWVESIKETCRQRRGVNWIEHLIQDFRYGFRMLRKNPGSSLLAVLILALGIGGTTAVFSVADKVLLNPIPGRNSDRLVALREVDVMHDSHWHVSPPLIEELATHSNWIESLTYCFQSSEEKKFRADARTIKLRGAAVALNFFELLELRPLAGRGFLPGEGSQEAQKTIIISHGLWQQYFGGDPQIIGQDLKLDGDSYSVVGIMPSNVQFPFGSGYSQFWVPRVFTSEEVNSDWAAKNRVWLTIARLRDGITLSELRSLLDVIEARRAPSVNEVNQRWTIEAKPARQSFASEQLQKTVWCLLAMMGALLLIACANVGNLLISQALSRRGEFGIRMAVGAGRLRVARQLLAESFTLAGIAAALGMFVAWGGIIALEQFYLSQLARINVIGLDWGVLGITCLVSGVVAVLFGTAPACLAARIDLNQSLKESAPQHSGGVLQRLFHDGLVVIQVCLAVVLLTGACLMTQSVVKLLRVDPGLEAKGLYRVFYDAIDFMNHPPYDVKGAIERGVPRSQALKESWRAHVEQHFTFQSLALERLHAVPGVESAAVNNGAGFSDYEMDGRPSPVYLGHASVSALQGDYLRTIGSRLVTGRFLSREDALPGQQSVVINERMAAVCWPGVNPLGKRFGRSDPKKAYVVVGVVKNIEDWRLESEVKPVFYEPYERETDSIGSVGDYVVRSSADADLLRDGLAQAGKQMLAPVDLRDFYSIETQLHRSTAPRRVMMWLLVSLGGLGLLLSALGVYAVLAHSVARRTREVGIRMAMGADRSRVRNLFIRQGVRSIVNGLILGIVAAITAGHYIESLLFGVAPADPWAFAAVVLTLGVAGGVACWLPARRAAQINPIEALRYE